MSGDEVTTRQWQAVPSGIAHADPSETLRDLTTLLDRCAAFVGVPPDRIDLLAAAAEIVYVDHGDTVPDELAGRPLVVQRGGLIVHDAEGRSVDAVSPGEFLSATTGQRLVAVAPTMLVLLPDEAVDLAWSAGRVGASAGTDVDVSNAAIHDVMVRLVHTAEPDETCREAAQRMRTHRISSLVVRGDEGRIGILTLRDLGDRLVAEGRGGDVPVGAIATLPARTIGPEARVGEALALMLSEGIHHLPVVRGEDLVGMVTGDDVLRAQTRSPLFLLREVGRATDHAELAAGIAGVPRTVATLLSVGTPAGQIARILSTVTDRVMAKLVHFAIGDLAGGGARPRIRWLVLGSQARGEQTLHTDQDTALLVPSGLDPAGREWAGAFGARITGELVALGYPRCNGGVMASEDGWRVDAPTWRGRVARWITEPSTANIMHAQISFDMREIALQREDGGGDANPPTGAAVHADGVAAVTGAPLFLARLARESLRHRPPIGFLGRFVVERAGEQRGTLDLKAGALLPIVNVARLHALAVGSTAVTTHERLEAAVAEGSMSADLATVLREGHELAQRLRLQQQVQALEVGAPPDNRVDPQQLSPLVRSDLREVFKAIRTAQEAVESRWRTGLLG